MHCCPDSTGGFSPLTTLIIPSLPYPTPLPRPVPAITMPTSSPLSSWTVTILIPRQACPSLPSRTPPCTAPLPAQAVGDKLVANAAVGRLSFKGYASLCKSFHPFQNDFIWVFNIRSIVCVSFFIIFFYNLGICGSVEFVQQRSHIHSHTPYSNG